jgi:flagella basal body P-ring formation protein FlgA
MSAISEANPAQFARLRPCRLPTVGAVESRRSLCLFALLSCALPVGAQAVIDDALAARVHGLATQAAAAAGLPGLQVDVQVGALDPRLKLAPCATVEPHLPPGMRLWGAARIGLRCTSGPVRWNVYLPLTVAVHGPSLVATQALPAGHVIAAADLRPAETLLSAQPVAPLAPAALTATIGRTLAHALPAGTALHAADLRERQWFAAGDTVRVVAGTATFRVQAEGQALGAGLEGRAVRVRTESGRIVTGVPSGEREVTVDP